MFPSKYIFTMIRIYAYQKKFKQNHHAQKVDPYKLLREQTQSTYKNMCKTMVVHKIISPLTYARVHADFFVKCKSCTEPYYC